MRFFYAIILVFSAFFVSADYADAARVGGAVGARMPNVSKTITTQKVASKPSDTVDKDEVADITAAGAKVKTYVIPTNEEYMIALDTQNLTK